MANEFLNNRVVAVNIPYPANTASTWAPTGVFIPTGAVVNGITMVHTGSPTVANAANTFALYVGTDIALMAVTAISDLNAAQTIPFRAALATTAGMYISKGGELYMKQGVSNGTNAWTYSPDVFVGFVKG